MMAVGAGPILAGPVFEWYQFVRNMFAQKGQKITQQKMGRKQKKIHRRGGEQAVNLEIPSCLTKDTIFHEVFHALGKGE